MTQHCNSPCCVRNDRLCCGSCGRLRRLTTRRCCLGCWLYVYFTLLVVAFLIGAGFLVSLSVDGRQKNVVAFNDASAAWPTAAPRFSGLIVSIKGDSPGNATLSLPAVTTADSYPDSDGLNIPSVFIHYAAATGSSSVPIAARKFNRDASVNLFVTISSISSPNGTTTMLPVSLFSKDNRLSALCFTVDAFSSPPFKVSGGCAAGDGQDSTAFKGDKSGTTFAVYIDVRSEADPYVTAMRVTRGSLFFGVSQIVKAIVGGVLTLASLILYAASCMRLHRTPEPEPVISFLPFLPANEYAMYPPPPAGGFSRERDTNSYSAEAPQDAAGVAPWTGDQYLAHYNAAPSKTTFMRHIQTTS
jgi:hypothetical protein